MKNLKITVLPSLIIILVSNFALAEAFKTPMVPDGEVRHYKVYYEGLDISKMKGKSLSERIMINEAAKHFNGYYFWKGTGQDRHLEYHRRQVLNNGNKTFYRIAFMPGEKLIMDSVEEIVTLPGGEEIRHQKYQVNHPFFEFPDDIMHPYVIETAFRGMPLEVGYERRFFVWINPQSLAPMSVKVEKIETIEAEAGTYECYKLIMKPQLDELAGSIAGRILSGLIPDYTFWLSTTPPHTYVRYAGPLGEGNTMNAPTEIHEMVSISIEAGK